MKTLPIFILLLAAIVIMIGIHFYLSGEDHRSLLIRQKEIDRLTLKNKQEADSLENVLKATQDSLEIALESIRQATAEREKAHIETQRLIKRYEKLIFVRFANDSARVRALTELYPSFGNN